MIVAGDGYAYVPYSYSVVNWPPVWIPNNSGGGSFYPPCTSSNMNGVSTEYDSAFTGTVYLALLRMDTSGNSSSIQLGSWNTAGDCYGGTYVGATNAYVITNADQGTLVTWQVNTTTQSSAGQGTQSTYYIATTSGTSLSSQNTMPMQITPVLQAQDGTFFGTDSNGNMGRFDQTGNIQWSVSDAPQIATADNGVIGISGITYDSNGNADGQTALAIPSWTGETSYAYGSVDDVINTQPPPATPPYASFVGLNKSNTGTSPPCHDDRDQLMPEYVTFQSESTAGQAYSIFVPSCQEFDDAETYGDNQAFPFSVMNESDIARNDHPNWALLRSYMLNAITAIVEDYDSALTVDSAYRSPFVQYEVTKEICAQTGENPCQQHPSSRHIHGDAVDFNTYYDQKTWQTLHDLIRDRVSPNACIEPTTTYDHIHVDWRPWSQCSPSWQK